MAKKSPAAEILGAFVVGAIVGGAIAMLFTPKTGEDMRDSIASTASDYADEAKKKGKVWARRAQEHVDDVKGRIQSIVES